MDLSKIDKNFEMPAFQDIDDIEWHNISENVFTIYGLIREDHRYVRMPISTAESTSENVGVLATHTAGGRVRFRTNSPYIAISAVLPCYDHKVHLTDIGLSGFDLYCGNHYAGMVAPDIFKKKTDGIVNIAFKNWYGFEDEFTVNFPSYAPVNEVYIGVKKGSYIEKTSGYANVLPFVYYGSSITQGACPSRPGNTYENMIARRFNTDYVNLGFSGSARGEKVMAEYIASLPMSVFVFDYAHNAPSAEWLKETHELFFKIIREAHPNVPVIAISRQTIKPSMIGPQDEEDRRKNIIRQTVENALAQGDENVYFIDGQTLFDGDNSEDCTIDCIHPNDLGFFRIAQKIGDTIEKILKS